MSEVELKKLFQIEDILSLPNAIFKIIFDNDERLHHIYRELLQLNTHDLSRDWFQDIYAVSYTHLTLPTILLV